jgi:hypothetical protein
VATFVVQDLALTFADQVVIETTAVPCVVVFVESVTLTVIV